MILIVYIILQRVTTRPILDNTYISSHSFALQRIKTQANSLIAYDVDIVNYYYYYALNIRVGTPLQKMQVLVDTGSSILWLANYTCDQCLIEIRYKPFDSSSYINLNESHSQTYGQGECSGVFGQELFSIANTSINTNFKFLLVNNESDLNFVTQTSGIMGLSNWNAYENIFESAYNEKQIGSPLYGFLFSDGSIESQLFYGQWNQTVLDQTIWIKTNMQKMWSLQILGIKIDDEVEYYFSDHSSLFDSGTSCLLLERNIYQSLYDKYFNCQTNCSCNIEYPTLTFYFKGASVQVPDSSYMIPHSNGICEVCIYPTDGTNVLGDPFMRQFISIFDKKNQQIGLYQAQQTTELKLWYFLTLIILQLIFIVIIISYMIMTKNL